MQRNCHNHCHTLTIPNAFGDSLGLQISKKISSFLAPPSYHCWLTVQTRTFTKGSGFGYLSLNITVWNVDLTIILKAPRWLMNKKSTPTKNQSQNIPYYIIPLMEDIRRSPVDMVNIPLFTGFHTCHVVIAGVLNHQEYFNMTEISWALRRSPRHWSLHKQASPCHSCWWAGFQVDLLYLSGHVFDGQN